MRAQGARHMREHHGGRTAEKKPSPSRRTVFDAILESDLPPPEKSLDRLEHEGREVIAAGSETTARMLTAATFFILATPGVLERLKSELKGIVAADGTIPDLAALERLPWLVRHLHSQFVTPIWIVWPEIWPKLTGADGHHQGDPAHAADRQLADPPRCAQRHPTVRRMGDPSRSKWYPPLSTPPVFHLYPTYLGTLPSSLHSCCKD